MLDTPEERATRGSRASLVGREREYAMLRERFTALRAGRGGLVAIGGAAGIGKTALVEAFGAEARASRPPAALPAWAR